jgi:hypothetical protein
MTPMIRRLFQFLFVRAPRNRFAAFGALILAMLFARHLMREATTHARRPGPDRQTAERTSTREGIIIDGEYRRLDPRR